MTSTTCQRGWILALAMLAVGSCSIDGDEACGPHQVYVSGTSLLQYEVCVCDEENGYVFDQERGSGCKRCPDDRTVMDGKCVAATPDGGAEQDEDGGQDEDAGPADGSTEAPPPAEPTGVGEYCESAADCAGFDAQYCAVQTNSCMVENCATGENACGSDTVCCDYSALLAGFSICIPDDQLVSDNCPMGGMKVEP